MFEVSKTDLAGRIGTIRTNHGEVATPAFVPVIHPVKQTIPAAKIRKMGFEMVITNAYIAKRNYGERAVKEGIHGIIGFDGAVMTDSGGYQVLEYGGVKVSPPEMAEFERGIMTDFAIPLDKPTGYGMSRDGAGAYVRHTLRVCKETLAGREDNGQIWVGPIQGGEHFDLVRRSAKELVRMGYPMLALGSPVEFMESYEYRLLAQMIAAARGQMPHSTPLHLFGAGHPLTIPFAVALGCDTFDSASYMLYAKQQRYITGDGTRRLADIRVFPCCCPVCSSHTPKELACAQEPERTDLLAVHNLYAIKLEVDRTRQAIHEGRLWEYVVKKARAHPRLFEMIGVMTENPKLLGSGTPRFKERAIFLFDETDQHRPEVLAFHGMVRAFRTRKKKVIIVREGQTRPGYLSAQYGRIRGTLGDFGSFQVCQYDPVLGLIPAEISDVFPAAHHETARLEFDPGRFGEFGRTWEAFFGNNKFSEIHYDKGDRFLAYYARRLAGIRKVSRRPERWRFEKKKEKWRDER